MGMAKRQRRPGSGRRPYGEFPGKTQQFTTRITEETRRLLVEAAKARPDRSLSAAAEHVLRHGLQAPSGASRNNALAAAIALLAEYLENGTKQSWLDDQFTGMALRYAVEQFLYWYAPTPEPEQLTIPAAVEEAASKYLDGQRLRKPARFGHAVAERLILEIEQAASQGPINEWSLPIFFCGKREKLAQIGSDLGVAKKKGRSK